MRFDISKKFSIDELNLDEENYRFRAAADQRQCIEKIYNSNASNFKNMMTSIAKDDLGEPLLVYVDENQNHVVSDGNRRFAALKVLKNPNLAPNQALKKHAEKLISGRSVNFDDIQAQVSHNKDLILKTVYERHAAGKGKSRMDWPALARARFGYENQTATDTDWRTMALIYEIERTDPSFEDFFNSKEYKHEVFNRIIPAAIKNNNISKNIFSDNKGGKIKTSEKKLADSALKLCKLILEDIKKGVIGLSRDQKKVIYASAEGISEYLERFEKATESEKDDSNPTNDQNLEANIRQDVNDDGVNSFDSIDTITQENKDKEIPMPGPAKSLHRKELIDQEMAKTRVQKKYKKSHAIYGELCRLESKCMPMACNAMLRIFLEITLKKTCKLLEECDWGYKAKLAVKTRKVAELLKELGYLSESDKNIVYTYSNTHESGLFTVNGIQSHMHTIDSFYPDQTTVNKYWDDLDPFCAACWKYIDKHDLN